MNGTSDYFPTHDFQLDFTYLAFIYPLAQGNKDERTKFPKLLFEVYDVCNHIYIPRCECTTPCVVQMCENTKIGALRFTQQFLLDGYYIPLISSKPSFRGDLNIVFASTFKSPTDTPDPKHIFSYQDLSIIFQKQITINGFTLFFPGILFRFPKYMKFFETCSTSLRHKTNHLFAQDIFTDIGIPKPVNYRMDMNHALPTRLSDLCRRVGCSLPKAIAISIPANIDFELYFLNSSSKISSLIISVSPFYGTSSTGCNFDRIYRTTSRGVLMAPSLMTDVTVFVAGLYVTSPDPIDMTIYSIKDKGRYYPQRFTEDPYEIGNYRSVPAPEDIHVPTFPSTEQPMVYVPFFLYRDEDDDWLLYPINRSFPAIQVGEKQPKEVAALIRKMDFNHNFFTYICGVQ